MVTEPTHGARDLAPALRLLPGLLGLLAIGWWTLEDGGYSTTVFLPGLLLFLGLGGAIALGRTASRRPLPGLALASLGLLAGYVAWSALSILWAQDAGLALVGTLRAALFLLVVCVFAALPWRTPSAARALTGIVFAVAGIGMAALLRLGAAGPEELRELLLQSRLSWPLAYQNANAALWTMAAIPAIVLASRRETFWLARPLLLAAAVLLLDLGLLSQSRGWLFTLPFMALATAVLVPGRARLLLWAVPMGLATAFAADAMLDVYREGGEDMPDARLGALAAAVDAAADRLTVAILIALAVGTVLTALDLRIELSARSARAGRWAAAAVVALAVAGTGVAGLAATDGRPGERLDEAWADFKANRTEDAGQGRFGAFGSSRYDFWRVSINEWREHPIAGLGQDNFDEAYLESRRNLTEEPRWTHSLPLRLLVHTGLVGFLLFLGFAALAVMAVARASRGGRWLPATLLTPALAWLLHGSVDWLWEYPALSALALAPAGIALALTRGREAGGTRLPAPARRGLTAVAAVAGVAVALAAGATFVSDRLVARAEIGWVSDPEAAFDDLDRAAAMQPLSGRPDLVAGLIALRRGEVGRAQGLLERAADRDPGSWFVHLARGLAATTGGDPQSARAAFERARELNPREVVVAKALRRSGTERPLTFDEAVNELSSRITRRFGSR